MPNKKWLNFIKIWMKEVGKEGKGTAARTIEPLCIHGMLNRGCRHEFKRLRS